jgi:hypothetical protein
MANLEETLDQAIADVRAQVGAYAASQGWQYHEERSTDDSMVFRDGMSVSSWGQWVTVTLAPVSESQTRVSVSTKPAGVQKIDWGKGKKMAKQLLAALQPAGGTPTTAS